MTPDAPPPAFIETQTFGRRWWWLLLALSLLLVGLPLATIPRARWDWHLLLLLVLTAPALALIWSLRLTVRVDAAGIHYQYLPLLWRWRHWPWTDFRAVYPRRYSPLGNYGGWGIRGLPGNLAYNVWGPHGLQLVFASGNRLLLGTQRPQQLLATLAALQAANPALPIEPAH